MKVGDILVYRWGYEQTNIDFVQVVKVTAKSAVIQAMSSKVVRTGGMCGDVIPDKLIEDGLEDSKFNPVSTQRKLIKTSTLSGRTYLCMPHGVAVPWDGKPVFSSWWY